MRVMQEINFEKRTPETCSLSNSRLTINPNLTINLKYKLDRDINCAMLCTPDQVLLFMKAPDISYKHRQRLELQPMVMKENKTATFQLGLIEQ